MHFPVEYYRETYKELRSEYPDAIISHSRLRQDQLLKNTKDRYQFTFRPSRVQEELPEILLALSDKFVALAVGMFLILQKTAKVGAELMQTYPNPQVFANGTPEDLGVVYNGVLDVQTNQLTYGEKLSTSLFLDIGETQQRAAYVLQNVGATENVAGAPAIANSSRNGFAGFHLTPSQWILDGEATNKLDIIIPTFDGIDLDSSQAGEEIKLVLQLDGFLINGMADGGPGRKES